ncbi:hypothetical protein PISMIDRAFT_677109, partial [Pisolithus microcarpus 441]
PPVSPHPPGIVLKPRKASFKSPIAPLHNTTIVMRIETLLDRLHSTGITPTIRIMANESTIVGYTY